MNRFRNLKKALDETFGAFMTENERDKIILAAIKDVESTSSIGEGEVVSQILTIFNSIFEKKFKILTKKVITRYKEILKHYSIADIEKAMRSAKQDEFHKEKKFKYCTPEYFSRVEQVEKWFNATVEKEVESTFVMPKFNVKQ
jgi:hypothetical protein